MPGAGQNTSVEGGRVRLNVRARAWFRSWYWLISIVLIMVSLTLGFVGYRRALGEDATALDALYKTLKIASMGADIVDPVPWELEVSRFATPLLFAHAIFVGLGALFWERYNLTRLLWWRDHVVICGLGKKGTLLAKEFRNHGYRVVAIDTARDNMHGEEFRFRDIILLTGDARDQLLLRRASVRRAKFVLAITGSDRCNAEIAISVRTMGSRTDRHPSTCFAHILDLDLCRFLREREVESVTDSTVGIEFFSIYESGARMLLAKYPFCAATTIATDNAPHIVVVGPGRFGASLILQAAREWRNAGGGPDNRLRVTIVDHGGDERLERLRTRFPQVDHVCEFSVVPLSTAAPEFAKGRFLFDINGRCTASTIYVCLDDESAGLTAAFTLNRCYERHGVAAPIVARMSEGSGFAALFSNGRSGETYNIRAFRLLDETCLPSKLCVGTNELIAQALHAQYLKSVSASAVAPPGDVAMADWAQLPETLKQSNRQQASHLSRRLRQCGYQIVPLSDWEAENFSFASEEVEQMARLEHERWCNEKLGAGLTHAPGPKTKATHPSLLPWNQLDDETREKARDIVRAAPRVLASVGFQVEKLACSQTTTAISPP